MYPGGWLRNRPRSGGRLYFSGWFYPGFSEPGFISSYSSHLPDMSEDIENPVKITLAYKGVSEDVPAVVEIGKDGSVISLNTREAKVLLKWLPFLLEEKEQAKIELTMPRVGAPPRINPEFLNQAGESENETK
jgi:hypothetical protein